MAQADVERVYGQIMALNDEEKLKVGEKLLALQRQNTQPIEHLELWAEQLKAQLGRK